jgi:hypothetical protein
MGCIRRAKLSFKIVHSSKTTDRFTFKLLLFKSRKKKGCTSKPVSGQSETNKPSVSPQPPHSPPGSAYLQLRLDLAGLSPGENLQVARNLRRRGAEEGGWRRRRRRRRREGNKGGREGEEEEEP